METLHDFYNNSKNVYYLYHLIDPRTDKVFYVGKGKDKRVYQHKLQAIKHKHQNKKLENKINSIIKHGFQPIERKVAFSFQEDFIFDLEILYIERFGLDNLCNLKGGGEGGSPSEETKKKISQSLKNTLDDAVKTRRAYYNVIHNLLPVKLLDLGIKFIPLDDTYMCSKADAETVKTIMEETFLEVYGKVPTLSIK